MMAKLQAIEPNAAELRKNFPEIFEKLVVQKEIEVFAPKAGEP